MKILRNSVLGLLFPLSFSVISCRPKPQPLPPAPIIEQHDVTVVQPKAKPTPKKVYRKPAPEDFRAVTTPN